MKRLRTSKTFWVNLIALGTLVVQAYTGNVISPEEQVAVLAVINLVLRIVTHESIEGL